MGTLVGRIFPIAYGRPVHLIVGVEVGGDTAPEDAMGATDGDTDRGFIGGDVGRSEGATLLKIGRLDGTSVGALGDALGADDGVVVGSSVGDDVGGSLGDTLGADDGVVVGSSVGDDVCGSLGDTLGADDGVVVGSSVGDDVCGSLGNALGADGGSNRGRKVGPILVKG